MNTATTPRVSIGLPVYNGERYLRETLESLLAQTFGDFELVISDNASTDATEAICREFASRDPRIRYHRNPENVGGSRNFCRVFELARAPYFKWSAHDDLCAATFLEKCVAVLDADPEVVLCYPKSGFIDQAGGYLSDHEDGCNLTGSRPSERVLQFFVTGSTYCFPMFGVIRRQALARTTLIAPYVCSDQVLLVQLALAGKFVEVPERLFFFREHPNRSIRQLKSFADYMKWHDPRKGSRIQLPRWRLAWEFVQSIRRSGVGWSESARSLIAVLKWCRWHQASLAADLVMTVRQAATLLTRATPIPDMVSLPPPGSAPSNAGGPNQGTGSVAGIEAR